MADVPVPAAAAAPAPVVLDGATLTPSTVALIAREGAVAVLAAEARARNDAAREALAALLARGGEIYGATTGVGALRDYKVADDMHGEYSLGLLRSHACGAGPPLPAQVVRAAMATRANQLGAGGAGVAPATARRVDRRAQRGPVAVHARARLARHRRPHEPRRHRAWRSSARGRCGGAMTSSTPARRLPRPGSPRHDSARATVWRLMSSNAVAIARAALLVVDSPPAAGRLAVGRGTVVRGRRGGPGRTRPTDPLGRPPARPGGGRGAHARAALRRRRTPASARARSGSRTPTRSAPSRRSTGPFTRRCAALEETVAHELNFAGENALIVAGDGVALPNGNPHAAPLANAIDNLRTALAQSAALIAARVSALLDASLTGLPPFLARPGRVGFESGALVLEYTAHAAVAEVRSLVTPVAAQTVGVSRGVESHSSLAPTAARRAQQAIEALRVAVATELVVAVRALRLAGQQPFGAGNRLLWEVADELLDDDLADRPLAPDVELARGLIEDWRSELR